MTDDEAMTEDIAIIKAGVVANVIVIYAGDYAFLDAISDRWDAWVPLDGLDPRPGRGWTYDGTSFTPPAE